MSGSRPFPTPVPASETLAVWQEHRGVNWVTRDDGKLFERRPGERMFALVQGQTESERVIRLIERQLNGGRELSPPYQPKRHLHPAPWRERPDHQHHDPEPVSGAAVIPPTITGDTAGETSGEEG
jgi:hypothetical protein